MVWKSAAAMEHHETLSLDGLEDSKAHAAAGCGGPFGRIGSVNASHLCLKMLGISLFAQQFTTASAAGICDAFDSIKTKFDLIGLISVFGTAVATKSLSYSALNDGSFYLTGHIGPGSLSVASVLFEAIGSRLARLLVAFGGTGDAYDLVQLGRPAGLRYIGLKSNTECLVRNAVGASIVREYQSLWKEPMALTGLEKGRGPRKEIEVEGGQKFGRRVGRDAEREVKVIILKVGRTKEMRVALKASKGGALLLGWLPLLLTIVVIASCCICKQFFAAGLIVLGTLGMMVAVLGLRLCLFKHSKPQVAAAAPEGDCLVVDDTNADILHVIKGEEESIQALLQRKIDYQASSLANSLLFLAGAMLYVYVVASVLYMPNVSTSGQIHFAIANLIGLVTDMVKASHNGKLGLAKKAREQFKIVPKDVVVFQNRTAAVAFVAKYAGDRTMLKSKKLLPCEGPVWQKWWEVLARCDGEGEDTSTNMKKSVVAAAEHKDQQLLKILLDDMTDGLQA